MGIYDINEVQALRSGQRTGRNAKAGYLNVSNYRQWQMALQEFKNWAGELNILVNNAGNSIFCAFENPIQSHHNTIDINVKGVLNGCHAALNHLQKSSFARVINLSSASAIYGQADLASYSASKFAVRGLTEALDVEWQNIISVCWMSCLLFVQTNMVKNMDAGSIQNIGVDLTPADVAKQVLHLGPAEESCADSNPYASRDKTKLMYQLSALAPVLNRLTIFFIEAIVFDSIF